MPHTTGGRKFAWQPFLSVFIAIGSRRRLVQQAVAQIPWGHTVRLMEWVKEEKQREWDIRQNLSMTTEERLIAARHDQRPFPSPLGNQFIFANH